MERAELYKEIQMTYEELVEYLLLKYGAANGDYFLTPECKSKNRKNSRTKEGLYCHHMDEDKGGNLSRADTALMQPFEWQKKERLIYCNILEHLILHFKIAVLRQKTSLKNTVDLPGFFNTGGIYMICSEINDMFMNDGTNVEYKRNCYQPIKNNYSEYILLIKALLEYISDCYTGDKSEPEVLIKGVKIHENAGDCEVVEVSDSKNYFELKSPSGEIKRCISWYFVRSLSFTDVMYMLSGKLSYGFDEKAYKKINSDINDCKDEDIRKFADALKVDFVGYGFAEYADIILDKSYGSENADQYISKAIPMYSDCKINLNGKKPVFWKGNEIPNEANDAFYIIRIETMFNIKKGEKAFVRYREYDWLRSDLSNEKNNEHNFRDRGWTVLSTSDIFDSKRQAYFASTIGLDGKKKNATVILSLGREDFSLFKEKYDISYMKVLDGCYFY